ncbi:MAG: T9SS type A sorting domain-containing protein [Saprospiraceae bacterium]|nr:T9SS type A sorting domain-containing protein [Saprospiraceae bacterium]
MNRLRLWLSVVVYVLIVGSVEAQRSCGTMDHLHFEEEVNPEIGLQLEEIERHAQQVMQGGARAVEGVISIPVVFHVVYNTAAQNISEAQIQSQIDILNEDFRRLNVDAVNTPDDFSGVASDVEIEFCLATVDPNGQVTNGITRTQTSVTEFPLNTNQDYRAVKFNSSGGKDAWPSSDYLNFWVANLGGGILGYATFPGGDPAIDGVVCGYRFVGNQGTATAPYNLGRTGTHEVGHWLNLRHIWGDGNCNADDLVADTPTAGGPNYSGSPCVYPGPNSCTDGNGDLPDMFQNYMDYSDDGCMNLFTAGQKDRMRSLFEAGGSRASLLNSDGCGQGTPPTCDDGIQNGDETGIDCGGSNCAPCPCPQSPLTLTINLDNYPEETSWSIINASNTIVASGGTYGTSPDGSTISEVINLAAGDYTFTINDSYGDGICCTYGNGSYQLTDANGLVIAAGGDFDSSESSLFCASGGDPTPTCTDGIQNGEETGVDCGGPDCPDCPTEPSCTDGVQNGEETGVDCGGPDCPACPTCDDGLQNGEETGIDCGGPDCPDCPSCNDGVQNGGETGIDCGGPDCPACPTCDDGIQNGEETGIDCGGPDCPDCPSCSDGIQNGQETGVDCGGPDCLECSDECTDNLIQITIVLDNFPEETSWDIRNGSTIIASGGPYGDFPDRATVTEEICLPNGCYDFTIYDTYGDGICCTYGQGNYLVTLVSDGSTLASGASFDFVEATNFCVGGGPEPTCEDGVQNGAETGIDCGGPDCPDCPTGPTCEDGIQNGDETGVDCGGSCAPCEVGCTEVNVNGNDFESNYGLWNDGGSDCRRVSNDAAYANSGIYCVRLRDNSNSSVLTTDVLNLSSLEELTVSFSYYARSMDNSNEDFWLQISDDGGASYTTIEEWNRDDEFQNNQRNFDTLVIPGPFSATTRVRFRCDASSNSDYVYLDDIVMTGCQSGNRTGDGLVIVDQTFAEGAASTEVFEGISKVDVFPNPTQGLLNVRLSSDKTDETQYIITDLSGRLMQRFVNEVEAGTAMRSFDLSNLEAGIYLLHVVRSDERSSHKFVVMP